MPLRTAKPGFRVKIVPEGIKVTLFPVVGGQRVRGASAVVPPNDKAALRTEIDRLLEPYRRVIPQ